MSECIRTRSASGAWRTNLPDRRRKLGKKASYVVKDNQDKVLAFSLIFV